MATEGAPGVPKTIEWSDGTLRLLDQTRLPHVEEYVDCRTVTSVYEAIRTLRVRGAPAIGIAAAYGLLVRDTHEQDQDGQDQDTHEIPIQQIQDIHVFMAELHRRADYLVSARPTAVNLAWAIDRMLRRAREIDRENVDVPKSVPKSGNVDVQNSGNVGVRKLVGGLEAEAGRIYAEDAAACRAIGEAGLEIVRSHPHVLTHCNAGALAVSELGTALAPIYLAHAGGIDVHVFVDETRPLLQGARLTAYELQRAGVAITLITDNAAAHVMSTGKVDAVIVGADRVAASGDVANKIGTLNLAILCRHFGLPFYVACPWSTIDTATPTGAGIIVEERPAAEVSSIGETATAPPGTPVFNPAFDITPADLVTAIITEKGVIEPPYPPKLAGS